MAIPLPPSLPSRRAVDLMILERGFSQAQPNRQTASSMVQLWCPHLDPFYSGSWATIPTHIYSVATIQRRSLELECTHMLPFPQASCGIEGLSVHDDRWKFKSGCGSDPRSLRPLICSPVSSGFYIPPTTAAASFPPIVPWGLFPSISLTQSSIPPSLWNRLNHDQLVLVQ